MPWLTLLRRCPPSLQRNARGLFPLHSESSPAQTSALAVAGHRLALGPFPLCMFSAGPQPTSFNNTQSAACRHLYSLSRRLQTTRRSTVSQSLPPPSNSREVPLLRRPSLDPSSPACLGARASFSITGFCFSDSGSDLPRHFDGQLKMQRARDYDSLNT